ncbi:MAG: CDP-diacylglycerol--serine O-phosphatidyltransferase, partial [Pseudomonadota bacterium]|nr:CDP-diacylglycerol--serine O-phosphatidyltransferase [Pseudomonadota bacterium]
DLKLITPILFIIVSILLISKIPTYSFKKIVVPRSTTIFLLLGIVSLFGLLLIFPFNVIALGSSIYLLAIPFSIFRYQKLKKGSLSNKTSEEDEPEDML